MKQKQLLTAFSEGGVNMHRESAAIPGARGRDYPSAGIQDPPERTPSGTNPSVRRQHVEQLLRRGLSNKEIAGELGVSVSVDTIKKDVQAICTQAGVVTTREYFAKLLHDISPKRS